MNSRYCLLIIFITFFQQINAQDSILNQLEGTWVNQFNPNELDIWKEDSIGWIGRAVTIKDKDTIVVEKLRIFYRNDSLFYEVNRMSNPGPVEFHLVASTDDEMVFVNMEHNFPKVIHYKMPDKEHLYSEVYGSNYAERLNFQYYRKPTWR